MVTRTYQKIKKAMQNSARLARFADHFYAGRIARDYTRFAISA